MQGRTKALKLSKPKHYSDKYTNDDIASVERIVDWLNGAEDDSRSQTVLARAAGMKPRTVQYLLKGKYPSPPGEWLAQLDATIERLNAREQQGHAITFVETSIYKLVVAACKRAHRYRNFAVVSTNVGTGKTTALKHYAALHARSTIMVEAEPDMNASVLLDELVAKTDADVHKGNRYSRGTKAERMAAVVRALRGSDKLLIVDEAETVQPSTLEYVRRISDKAGIGVVFAGTAALYALVRDPLGQFGQISSRVGFWPDVVKSITPDDSNALVDAALNEFAMQPTPEIYDACWQVASGSARVLLGPGQLFDSLRDYGLSKGKPLTAQLVFKIGQECLGYKPQRKREVL